MNSRVIVEAAVPVYDVGSADEAVRIAISKTGEMLNPDLNYVEIDMGERTAPSGEELLPAFVAADEALVALELEMTVFNVEDDEHAARIARKEIGQRMPNVPLEVLRVDEVDEEGEPEGASDPEPAADDRGSTDGSEGRNEGSGDGDEDEDEDENGDGNGDVLPEFEDLIEE